MLKEAWRVRDHPNMHYVFYEDLKADIDGELKKINDFIGTELTDQQLQNVWGLFLWYLITVSNEFPFWRLNPLWFQ